MQASNSGIPTRRFGRSDARISILGFGGHHLGEAPDQATAEAARRGIAVLGMKSLGGSGEMVRHGALTAQQGLRYAMSLPVATTISGVDSMEVLEQNLIVAVNFQPFSGDEMAQLRDRCRTFALDGRFELFKTSTKYDGKIGCEQHHFPSTQELPL